MVVPQEIPMKLDTKKLIMPSQLYILNKSNDMLSVKLPNIQNIDFSKTKSVLENKCILRKR